jgi:hypothetical protein
MLAGVIGAVMLGGCGTPPAVLPLMRSAQKTLKQERDLLGADQARRAERFEQQRESLRSGYEADLAARDEIDAEWVREGTRAYVTAREALLRQEMELERQTETRRRNLKLAGEALDRAAELIHRQDRLLGVADPWRLLDERNALGGSVLGEELELNERKVSDERGERPEGHGGA